MSREAGVAGHTPGPWTIGAPYGMHGVEVVGDDGNRRVCGVIAVDRDQYDKGGRKLANVPDAEGWANARLIASAPGLLAALQGLLTRYVTLVESGDAGFWDAEKEPQVIAARAAIARATGVSA